VRLGIDATNLRRGGGLTHLIALLRAAEPQRYGFKEVVIWGDSNTLARIDEASWLRKIVLNELDKSILSRVSWRLLHLGPSARREGCNLLFSPGGSILTKFRPIVTMSRNMLPFQWRELFRYGFSPLTLKFIILRFMQSRSFRKASGVIFLNDWARTAVGPVVGPSEGPCAVIPHGVDAGCTNEPKEQRSISEYGESNPFRLLYVSIIDVYKHQWNVVAAVARLRKKGFPATLDLAGPAYGPSLRRLRRSLKRYEKEEIYVSYLGELGRKELHQSLREADLFVFASSCENMPNILLEGMAAGLPVACSDRGPMPEILADAGVYFDPESIDSIASAIETLISDPALRAKNARLAYSYSQQYTWKKCADETFRFLATVAKPHAALETVDSCEHASAG